MKWIFKVILVGELRNEVFILDIILIDVIFFNFFKKNILDYMFFYWVWIRCIINFNYINDWVIIFSLMNEKIDVYLVNLVFILYYFMKNLKNLIW